VLNVGKLAGIESAQYYLDKVATLGLNQERAAKVVDELLGRTGLTAHASSFTPRDVVLAVATWSPVAAVEGRA
jgi:hypothetical protein